MPGHDWTLTVQFGYDYDDQDVTGEEEAETFKRFLLADWALDEDELQPGEIVVEGDTVTVRVDVLDYLSSAIRTVLGITIPKKLHIDRND